MKKQILLLVPALVFCLHLQAQIILTQSNTNFTPGPTIALEADTTGFVIPSVGVNRQWNYSNLTKTGVDNRTMIVPSNVNFPTATYVDTNVSTVFIPGWYYYYDPYLENAPDGVKYLGYVVKNQRYGIQMTGNPKDSCIFPEQFLVYGNPNMFMPFPSTMSSSWHLDHRNVLNFQLTIASYGLNKTSCQKVTHIVGVDTVVSWGKMRIPTNLGPSLAYDVLLVKRMISFTDSFYMAGTPAPAGLLNAFGVAQGQRSSSGRYLFWREDARYTLLMVNFDSLDCSRVKDVFYDGTAEYDPNYGFEDLQNSGEIAIYPNPASERLFIKSTKIFSEYFIYNQVGDLISSGIIRQNTINLEDIPRGLYFAKLKSGTGTKVVKFIRN
jgi:hypothetical protein